MAARTPRNEDRPLRRAARGIAGAARAAMGVAPSVIRVVQVQQGGAMLRGFMKRLESLVQKHLSVEEDGDTVVLSRRLQAARRRGYLTPLELEAVCRWKSARAIRRIRENTYHRVRAATGAALASRNEQRRLEALLQLSGVGIPMASALLTLVEPNKYGVIDIRVWQLLYTLRMVRGNPKGTQFRPSHWNQFLAILRRLASRLGVGARDIERTLFDVHQARQRRQKETLYGPALAEAWRRKRPSRG